MIKDKEEKLTKGHQGPAIIYIQWPYRVPFQPRFGDIAELGTPLRIRYFEIIILLPQAAQLRYLTSLPIYRVIYVHIYTYIQLCICMHLYIDRYINLYMCVHIEMKLNKKTINVILQLVHSRIAKIISLRKK